MARARPGMALAAPILMLLLAGCSDGGGRNGSDGLGGSGEGAEDPQDEANRQAVGCCPCVEPAPDWCLAGNETAEALPVVLELTGCLQMRTSFPYPVAAFSQLGFQLPPGFAFASSDGQTVEAFLAWWSCPEGRLTNSANDRPFPDVGSMFASLPVVPPSDLAGLDPRAAPVELDLVPLTWILSSQLASDHLGRIDGLRGGYVEEGDVRVTSHLAAGAGEVFSAQAPASFGVFDVDAAIQSAPADQPEGRYRMWLWDGEHDVTAYLDLHNAPGTALGSGAADLRFAGDPDAGAPPATVGTADVVDGIDVAIELVQLR